MNIKRGLADTPEGQLHYRVAGDGPPLVLLHMTNLSSRAYVGLMSLLPGFRTYAVDLPGFGYSDPLEGKPDIRTFALCVVHFMDTLGIKRAHIFGLHAGNKIGATLAAYWPERVERFVLAGMTHSLISDQPKRLASIPDYAHKLHETRKATNPGLDLKDWAMLFSNAAKIWWRPSVVGKDAVTDGELRQLEDEVLDLLHGRQGYGAFYLASWAFDIGETLAKVAAPTLVIELATPREAHLGRQAPVLEKLMPNCRSVTVEMNDGDLLYRHPEVLARCIIEFLSG
ncbi:MAG: alpha/beta hydrolase [Betaproteobacteria bacterium]|nr:alpha/beta hydrolase [Betaproteobacteria bacterium]